MPPYVEEQEKEKVEDVVVASYVCNNLEKPIVSNVSLLSQVPVIDMEKLLSNYGDDDTELKKLHLACKDWGFFQMINHGVSSSLLEKVRSEIQGFFNLSIEEKKQFERQVGNLEGYGEMLVSYEQKIESLVGMFYLITHPTHLRQPHLLPKFPLSLRDALEEYSTHLKELAMKMFNIMGKALGMKAEEDLSALFDGGKQSMRMNYYPKCPQPGVVMGLNPHSDGAGLTILLQLNEVEGLHIKKDGAWIPITPLPNAFVVNIADMLEIVTNGIYKSVKHRPVFNPNNERLSVATFFEPRSDGNLCPAESLITPQNPAKFKHIGTVADYAKGFFSRQLGQGSYLDTMRIVTEDQENNR